MWQCWHRTWIIETIVIFWQLNQHFPEDLSRALMNIKRGAFSNICLLPSPSPGYIVSLTRRLCQSIFSCHISIVTAPTHPPNIWYVYWHVSSLQTRSNSAQQKIQGGSVTSCIKCFFERHGLNEKFISFLLIFSFCWEFLGILCFVWQVCADSENRKLCQREKWPEELRRYAPTKV